MKAIFLSASVPLPERHERYHSTSDVIAIRDAVRALATVVLPHAELHWGGHPSIPPLIRVVAQDIGITDAAHVHLYQSAFFSKILPTDNAAFERYVLTDEVPAGNATRDDSLTAMRRTMIGTTRFDAGIFIGGMEGVEEEFELFRQLNPEAILLPIASTGAAAQFIYERERQALDLPDDLLTEYSYPTLFRRLIGLPDSRGHRRPKPD
jgi:hypothetical protein